MNPEKMTDEQINEFLGEFMGWKWDAAHHGWRDSDGKLRHFAPLRDANHTLMVIEAMREKGWWLDPDNYSGETLTEWQAEFVLVGRCGVTFSSTAKTPHRAVCLAAIKATGYEGEQK